MISVNELTKRFPSARQEVVAVDHLTFSVRPGEVYGLLGPNGAGKTTTLRMILGLVTPSSGTALVSGYSVIEHPNEVKRRIGYASANVGVYPWLKPREMLNFVGDLFDMPLALADARIDELAELLDFKNLLNQRCATLSTGQKQRINLARALLHDPPVMLMDEPTLGLDIVGSKVIFDYIDHLRSQEKAVVVCTHRLDEAERLCDRYGLLHNGRLQMEGTLRQLCKQTQRDNLTDIFLDLLNDDQPNSSIETTETRQL